MKPLVIVGIILIVLGLGALIFQGLSYTTSEKKMDFGPIQVTKEETKRIPLPPIAGALACVSGVVLVVVGNKKP